MKILSAFLTITLTVTLMSCNKDDKSSTTSGNDKACGDHQGKQLYKDSSGNCYYLDNGNKVMVETHECNC